MLKRLQWLRIDKEAYSRTYQDDKKLRAYAWKYDVPDLRCKYHINDINAAIGIE